MDYQGRPFYLLGGGGGGGGGTGNVVGPSSSNINTIPLFADNTGKLLKNSLVTVDNTSRMTGVLVLETDFVQSTLPNSLTLESPTRVTLLTALSTVETTGMDVLLNAAGTVSLTGGATPTAIALNGPTLITGKLSLTSTLQLNGSSQIKGVALPTLATDVANREYVDNATTVKWAQLLFNNISNLPLFLSGQLSTSIYNRLLVLNDPIPPNYYISYLNILPLDNVGFAVISVGTYKIRYKIGVKSNNATLQTLSVLLRIGGVNFMDTEQFMPVSNASITYHDFEYIFTITIPDVDILLFSKVSAVPDTLIETSYLNFNIFKI